MNKVAIQALKYELRENYRDSESSATDRLKLKEKNEGGGFLHQTNTERIGLGSSCTDVDLGQCERCPAKNFTETCSCKPEMLV